jgi:hypothetical protein
LTSIIEPGGEHHLDLDVPTGYRYLPMDLRDEKEIGLRLWAEVYESNFAALPSSKPTNENISSF